MTDLVLFSERPRRAHASAMLKARYTTAATPASTASADLDWTTLRPY